MNATTTEDRTPPIAGPDRLMLATLVGFMGLIAAFIIGDLIQALMR